MATDNLEGCGQPVEASGTPLMVPTVTGPLSNETPLIISTLGGPSENGTAPEQPATLDGPSGLSACPWWLVLLALAVGYMLTRNRKGS